MSVLTLWLIGMVPVVLVAALVSRKSKAKPPRIRTGKQERDWRSTVYSPKEFRRGKPPP